MLSESLLSRLFLMAQKRSVGTVGVVANESEDARRNAGRGQKQKGQLNPRWARSSVVPGTGIEPVRLFRDPGF